MAEGSLTGPRGASLDGQTADTDMQRTRTSADKGKQAKNQNVGSGQGFVNTESWDTVRT